MAPKQPTRSTQPALGLTAQGLIAQLGLPSVLVQVMLPGILRFLQRYPRMMKILKYVLWVVSAFGTFTFGVRPVLQTYVWDWLPTVQMSSQDLLYTYLRDHVLPKCVHITPNILKAHSSIRTTESDDADIVTATDSNLDGENDEDADECGSIVKEMLVGYRNPSSRVFWHKGTFFTLEAPFFSESADRSGGSHDEELSLRAFSFSHKPLKSLLQEAVAKYTSPEVTRMTSIYVPCDSYGTLWQRSSNKQARSLSTINIDRTQKRTLVADIAKYLSPGTKEWYRKRGIPRRRGYLFHGPPGTGKSSMAAAIAGYFKASLYTISLSDSNLSDRKLLTLLNAVPQGNVVLLDHIDCAGVKRQTDDYDFHNDGDITLSGLLNALDGASAPEGHILIMSTNEPETLDSALVRAGRVDRWVEFRNAMKPAIINIFLRMMENDDEDEAAAEQTELQKKAEDFAKSVPEETFSPAELQGYLLDHVRKPESAIDNAEAWVKEMIEKRADAQKAKEEKAKAKQKNKEERQQEKELEEKKQALEKKTLKEQEEAAAALAKMDMETKALKLKAEKLQAEAVIAKLQKKNDPINVEQEFLMTPADSDDERLHSAAKDIKMIGE